MLADNLCNFTVGRASLVLYECGVPDLVRDCLNAYAGQAMQTLGQRFLNQWLIRAADAGNDEVVRKLIDVGADKDTKVMWSDVNSMEMTLNKGKTATNAFMGSNVTPLILGSYNGHIEVVKLLLEAGADINKEGRTGSGFTPLLAGFVAGLPFSLPACPFFLPFLSFPFLSLPHPSFLCTTTSDRNYHLSSSLIYQYQQSTTIDMGHQLSPPLLPITSVDHHRQN